jgi:transposase-like protein
VLDGATWQRRRTHFMRNLLAKVPRSAQPMVASLVRTIFAQERAEDAWRQLGEVVAQLTDAKLDDAAQLLGRRRTRRARLHRVPLRHLAQDLEQQPPATAQPRIRRRTDVVGILRHRPSVTRLVGAVLVEQHDEWPSPAATSASTPSAAAN